MKKLSVKVEAAEVQVSVDVPAVLADADVFVVVSGDPEVVRALNDLGARGAKVVRVGVRDLLADDRAKAEAARAKACPPRGTVRYGGGRPPAPSPKAPPAALTGKEPLSSFSEFAALMEARGRDERTAEQRR